MTDHIINGLVIAGALSMIACPSLAFTLVLVVRSNRKLWLELNSTKRRLADVEALKDDPAFRERVELLERHSHPPVPIAPVVREVLEEEFGRAVVRKVDPEAGSSEGALS